MRKINRFLFPAALAAFVVACGGSDSNTAPALSSNARLADLSISAGEFDQIFQSNLTDYTATVSLLRSTTTVTATLEDPNATLTVNGAAVASATVSGKFTLDVGSNSITVSVTAEDGVTQATYTIDVTRQTVASFAQRAYIKASNTQVPDPNPSNFDDSDQFGNSIALSNDTLVVGAVSEDSAATGIDGDQNDNSAHDSGAVYVFTRDPAGVWSQQAYIKASNTEISDGFGSSVALSGDTLAVSARFESSASTGIDGDQSDNSSSQAGAVYVFTRDAAGVWSQQAYVKASNTQVPNPNEFIHSDQFGHSIALSSDTLAVGAPSEDSAATGINGDESDNSMYASGAVYVYTRDSANVWSQQAYIKASNTGSSFWDDRADEYSVGDQFGWSVAISGDTLVVGAHEEDGGTTGVNGDDTDDSGYRSGAAYVFTRDAAGIWSQQAYLKASNTGRRDTFGYSVAISGNTLAVGAVSEDGAATGIGGDQNDNSAHDSGAVYVYSRNATGTWSQEAYIKASNTDVLDFFGWRVALSGDTLAVRASTEDSGATGINGDQNDDGAEDSGAVYVFTRDAARVWTQQAYVKALNTDVEDAFGYSVAISGNTLAVGAVLEDSAATGIDGDQSDNSAENAGAVYVFQ